jgi:hypothetical protein
MLDILRPLPYIVAIAYDTRRKRDLAMANPRPPSKDTWQRGAIRGAVAMGCGALANEMLPLRVVPRLIIVAVVAATAYLVITAILRQRQSPEN